MINQNKSKITNRWILFFNDQLFFINHLIFIISVSDNAEIIIPEIYYNNATNTVDIDFSFFKQLIFLLFFSGL